MLQNFCGGLYNGSYCRLSLRERTPFRGAKGDRPQLRPMNTSKPPGILAGMSEVTRILDAIQAGEPHAVGELLPLVYEELRRVAAAQMAREKPGQTLDATALVHEAYLRLAGDQQFENRRHFLAAAGEAMRRILVENARRKHSLKRGGDRRRLDLDVEQAVEVERSVPLVALDEALDRLEVHDHAKAELVKLRYFAGMTIEEAAETLAISVATANRWWSYARAWLHEEIRRGDDLSMP